MKLVHLAAENYIRQPWKNGGGTTTEIVKQIDNDRVVWRLSIAAVEQSGPFSDFTGFDRTIMLLKGNGMGLSFGGAEPVEQRIDKCHVPFPFAGERKTYCRLIDGPVEDFNLMVDRQRAHGQLQVRELSNVVLSIPLIGDTEVLYCLCGCASVDCGAQKIKLQAGETLHIDTVAGTGKAVSIELCALDFPCSVVAVQIALL